MKEEKIKEGDIVEFATKNEYPVTKKDYGIVTKKHPKDKNHYEYFDVFTGRLNRSLLSYKYPLKKIGITIEKHNQIISDIFKKIDMIIEKHAYAIKDKGHYNCFMKDFQKIQEEAKSKK